MYFQGGRNGGSKGPRTPRENTNGAGGNRNNNRRGQPRNNNNSSNSMDVVPTMRDKVARNMGANRAKRGALNDQV